MPLALEACLTSPVPPPLYCRGLPNRLVKSVSPLEARRHWNLADIAPKSRWAWWLHVDVLRAIPPVQDVIRERTMGTNFGIRVVFA